MRVTTGSDAVLSSPTFIGGPDGVTPTDTDTLPTVVVTNDVGTTVPTSAVTKAATGRYQATITAAHLPDPDLLTVVWSGVVAGITQATTEQVPVDGGVYVSTFDLWNLKDLPVTKMFPADVVELREEFEALAEEYMAFAWVPRFSREIHPVGESIDYRHRHQTSNLHASLVLDHTLPTRILSAISVFGAVTIDTTLWQLTPSGLIEWSSVSGPTTIRYVHGHPRPPATLVAACKDYVRSKALERFGGNRIGRDVISSSDGAGGSTRYSTPDWSAGRPTGYFDIDRVLNSLGTPLPGVG